MDHRQSPQRLVDTFLHETIEAIVAIYGLNVPHSAIQTLGVALSEALKGMLDLQKLLDRQGSP
jgi:hypothetical protein